MRSKLIHIVIPSRDRHDIIENTFYSFGKLADNPDCFGMTVILDEDDKESHEHLNTIKVQCGYDMKILIIQRSEWFLRDYYNHAYSLIPKDTYYLRWSLGNDTPILTPHWDTILSDNLQQYWKAIETEKKLLYISIDDSTIKGEEKIQHLGCCFPILTDNSEIGGPNEIKGWGADTWMHKYILKDAERVNLRDKIKVDHISAHTGKYWSDNVAYAMAKRTEGTFSDMLEGRWVNLVKPADWKPDPSLH